MGIVHVGARIAGLAVDARVAVRSANRAGPSPGAHALLWTGDLHERAEAARWIAANLLAIRGLRVGIDGPLPVGARRFDVRVASVTGLLAAVAAVPSLVDVETLPVHWRVALAALGVPAIDRAPAAVLARGVSVVGAGSGAGCALAVDAFVRGFRVRIADGERMLVA
jgi:hypothetical protein